MQSGTARDACKACRRPMLPRNRACGAAAYAVRTLAHLHKNRPHLTSDCAAFRRLCNTPSDQAQHMTFECRRCRSLPRHSLDDTEAAVALRSNSFTRSPARTHSIRRKINDESSLHRFAFRYPNTRVVLDENYPQQLACGRVGLTDNGRAAQQQIDPPTRANAQQS